MAEADGPLPEASSQAKVRLVASTGDVTSQGRATPSPVAEGELEGYFESAQWTADGTTILTSSSSRVISAYVLPEDLLDPKSEPLGLSSHITVPLSEPTNVLSSAPYFKLSEPYTNQILVSSRDHPIQLFYLFPSSTASESSVVSHLPASSYPFTKVRSETFLSAASLIWPSPGSHFIAGCRNLIAKFDVSRTGSEPVMRIKTIPSDRHLLKGGGVGMRGIVSSLSAQPPDENGGSLVAAATWTRWVGLYDFAQAGECVATWSIEAAARETQRGDGTGRGVGIGGGGITQTAWSPCGRYLLISERKSTGIMFYDIRMTGQMVGWLEGREAIGNQRIHCDVFPGSTSAGGFEVWSGTTSGTVKVWEGVGNHEGAHEAQLEWQGHGSTVGSTCLHPSGAVVATCSGSWEFPEDEAGLDNNNNKGEEAIDSPALLLRRNKESSLKIWSVDSETTCAPTQPVPIGHDE